MTRGVKKDTSLEDIADAINGLAVQMDERFEQVDKRFEQVDKRFEQVDKRFDKIELRLNRIETEQHKMREWLEKIDNSIAGLTSDVAEIYDRILFLEKQVPLTVKAQKELQNSFEQLFSWAKLVSVKTGVKLPELRN